VKFSDLFPLQFYINLDKRQDRRLLVENEFKKMGLKPKRFSGFIFNGTTSSWWNGALGCMLSHLSILEIGLKEKVNVFIFEDDVEFIYSQDVKFNPYEILDLASDELSQLNWDMFYGGGNLLKPCYQETKYLAKLTFTQSTVCYGVNFLFIEKLLNYFNLDKINRPIDLIYAQDVIPFHNAYITIPMLAKQRSSFSDIEQRNVSYGDYLEARYWNNLVRNEL